MGEETERERVLRERQEEIERALDSQVTEVIIAGEVYELYPNDKDQVNEH